MSGTRFHLESWRKLYRTLPPSWLMLPLSARGLGDEMIKYVDDDGLFALPPGEPMTDAVCRIMCAHRKERKRVGEDLADLIRDGYLVKVENGLLIRNFVVAQGRTPSAKRMADMRERQRNGGGHSNGSGDGNGGVTVTRTVTSRSDGSDTTRHDTTRHDGEVPSAPPPGPAKVARGSGSPKPPKPDPHPRYHEVVEAYFAAFEAARGSKPVFDGADGPAVNRLLARMFGDADKAIAVIRAAYADAFKARNATIRTIATDPSKYLGAPAPINGRRPVQPIGQRPQKTIEDHYRDNPPTDSEVPF